MSSDFCAVEDFDPSTRTKQYIKEMNDVADLSNLLSSALSASVLINIFSGRSTRAASSIGSAGYNISSYNWSLFQDAMNSVSAIRRNRLRLASSGYMYSSGKDKLFWRCIVNAL